MKSTPSRIPRIVQRSPTPLRYQRLNKNRTLFDEESKQLAFSTI